MAGEYLVRPRAPGAKFQAFKNAKDASKIAIFLQRDGYGVEDIEIISQIENQSTF